MEVMLCNPFKSLLNKAMPMIEKLPLNSTTFRFIQQQEKIRLNFQTFISFKKRCFLDVHVLFHCIFSLYRGSEQGLVQRARILLVF